MELNDKNLRDSGLPSPNRSKNVIDAIPSRTYNINELLAFFNSNVAKLVVDQKIAFDTINEGIENNSGRQFFLDAPRFPGKAFFANSVLPKVLQSGKKHWQWNLPGLLQPY